MNIADFNAFLKARGFKAAIRTKEELNEQIKVARWLEAHLPEDILWTASAAGARLGPKTLSDMIASGLKAGWPDLQFLFPDGVTRYIEMKSRTGSLDPAQRTFRDHARRHGIWAVCRSLEEVIATLRGWGVVPVGLAA